MQEREAWANSFQSIFTPILLAIGGLFALYEFIFEGAFSRRLQPDAAATIARRENRVVVNVSLTAENIGKRKIDLDSALTRLSVSFATKTSEEWSEEATRRVLKEQVWINPGETVGNQVRVTILDEDVVAVQLEFYVASTGSEFWMHREIVNLAEDKDTI